MHTETWAKTYLKYQTGTIWQPKQTRTEKGCSKFNRAERVHIQTQADGQTGTWINAL